MSYTKWPWQKKMSPEQVEREKAFLKYFHVGEDSAEWGVDIGDEDVKRWLWAITRHIQKGFSKNGIKNYLEGTMVIGGQRIAFAFMKDGGRTPHELRLKAESRVAELEAQLHELLTAPPSSDRG